jgi:hypothetical protein
LDATESGYSGSNRAMRSLDALRDTRRGEDWPLTKRIPALMAVPTDTAEAGAFGTAGAGLESRTRLRNVPGSVASEDEPALVDPWGNAPHRSACKAKQRPFASEPKRFAGCRRIERHPADLESAWPPWPAPQNFAPRTGNAPVYTARQAGAHTCWLTRHSCARKRSSLLNSV